MYDIFISYASEDVDFVKELAEDLENEGFSVWWDISIPTGKNFDEVIEEALKKSSSVVVLWSTYSVGSDWVRLEAGEGRAKKRLVPVKIEEVKIPFAFKNIQTANLIHWNRDHDHPDFRRLVNDINSILGLEPEPPQPPVPRITSFKKYLLPAILVVSLVLAGIFWIKNR